MELKPILIDTDPALPEYDNPYCRSLFESYPAYYHRTGYDPPFIGYFVFDAGEVVGVGGFIGRPVAGQVEIAYGTVKSREGRGIARFTSGELIRIARQTDPRLVIMAKTAPERNASNRVLARHGFVYTRIVTDEGIGDAWEWILRPR